MKHKKKIIVKCWKCKKPFDIVTAERCHEHWIRAWTTKCSYCGACICHKIDSMKEIECEVLNNAGITAVMPSVYNKLTKEVKRNNV